MNLIARYISIFLFSLCSAQVFAQYENLDKLHVPDSNKTRHLTRAQRLAAFRYPGKHYFLEGSSTVGIIEFEARLTGGYTFGQFGTIGAGIGAGVVFSDIPTFTSNDPVGGGSFPLFVHYSGDILRERITPYYVIEVGYAFRADQGDTTYLSVSTLNHAVYKYIGGFNGMAAFGLKAYLGKKLYLTFCMELDIKQYADKYTNYFTNSIGENVKVSYSTGGFLYMPGFRLALGH